jgi:PIN domain nuclease of toxin-antitoxin system
MRVLLDTHAFLWFIYADPQLSVTATDIIGDPENERLLSVASIWEMSIKVQLGKLNLPSPLDTFLTDQLAKNQVQLLSIEFAHAVFVHSMPPARFANGPDHKDPFDRLIVAQALVDGIPLVSVDAVLDEYGITRVW